MSSLKTDAATRQTAVLPKKRYYFRKHLAHLFLLPAVVIYGVFQLYPLMLAVVNSFYSWNGFTQGEFVGFENFITLFTQSPYKETFLNAFIHNCIFFIGSIFAKMVIAYLLALLIYSKVKGSEFFKAIYFLPHLLSVIVIGYLFSLILNPTSGALNTLLRAIGLDFLAKPWLGSMDTALGTIILVSAWASIGLAVLIFLAGLQSIDTDVFDAAKIDGANRWQMLWKITIPMSMPSIMIMTILTFIGSFETFELIFAMQGSSGGPFYSTDVLATYFYRLAFGSVDGGQAIGLGSAIAVVLFLIIAVATALLLFYFKRKDFER